MAKTKNDNNGWQIVAYVAIAVILVSLLVLGMRLTGYAIESTGIVRVNISSTAAINFTSNLINFGNGTVNPGKPSATLESNATAAVDGDWTWTAQHFILENVGNTNVALNLKTNQDATGFLGGTSPAYQYSVNDYNTETGSCGTPLVTLEGWNTVSTIGTDICTSFPFTDANDQIQIDVRLVIPSDASPGELSDTFTATGTAI
ncbi:MAG: hypothetical protein WC402_01265 [Candidatus Pacearchaeota archaeon]|jgi:hypothetical protein